MTQTDTNGISKTSFDRPIESKATERASWKIPQGGESRGTAVRNNTEEEWEEVVQMYRENKKRKRRKKRESLGRNF